MFEINLLPSKHRQMMQGSVSQSYRIPALWAAGAVVVGLVLVPLLLVVARSRTLDALNGKIHTLQPKREAVDQLQQRVQRLKSQELAFAALSKEANVWSKRLNVLSDLTPEGVWFNELVLVPGKDLVIRGSALVEGGVEMVRVGRLVQDLKADAEFSAIVKEIEIESIQRARDGEIEVVRFTLMCTFQKGQEA